MTALIHHIQHIFRTYHVPLDKNRMEKLAQLSYESPWCKSDLWYSHSTPLDQTTLYYFLPDRYEALKRLTETDFDYVEMTIGDITIYAMGLCSKPKPFGLFFNSTMKKNLVKTLTTMSLSSLYEMRFALALNEDMKVSKDQANRWKKSYADSFDYLTRHRHIVRRVGEALSIPMEDHDLTKTTLVSIALAGVHHWTGPTPPHPASMAQDVILHCHCELESHHPQHHDLDKDKLFADRISVRLQKEDPVPEAKGFDVDDKWIPDDCAAEWEAFKQKYAHINLYSFIAPAHPN